MNFKAQLLERERRWALAAGILSVLGVAMIAFSYVYAGSSIPGGDGAANYLTNVDENRSALILANAIQAIGLILLVAPLVFLFKAASARSDRMKAGLIGVVIVAPLFLGAASMSNAISTLDAATTFKEKSAPQVEACINEKNAENGSSALGATGPDAKESETKTDTGTTGTTGTTDTGSESTEDIATDCADDTATDVRNDSNSNGITVGLGLAGAIGFAISVAYIALWCMRVGLISRFWGSLGIALGAVSILFLQFTLLWFIYAGLLIAGWIPGGRPEAWAAGEAVPWPMPGTDDEDDDDDEDGDVIEGSAEPVEPGEASDFPDDPDSPQLERRKRKKRNT
jgi:drug/metabolite transporter (DMT)-like permease